MTKIIDNLKKHFQKILTNDKEPIIDKLTNANIDKLTQNQEDNFTNEQLKTKTKILQHFTMKRVYNSNNISNNKQQIIQIIKQLNIITIHYKSLKMIFVSVKIIDFLKYTNLVIHIFSDVSPNFFHVNWSNILVTQKLKC